MMQHGFYFDQSRCIGCNACVACLQAVARPSARPAEMDAGVPVGEGPFPEIRAALSGDSLLPLRQTGLRQGVPQRGHVQGGAIRGGPDRLREMPGTRKCWKACPYGSIRFRPDRPGEKASKCTMCIDRLQEGKKPICVLSCSMRALEFGPLNELRSKFGDLRQLEDCLPAGTGPSVVFKPRGPKKPILPWDAGRALVLWKKRGPYAPADVPDLFVGPEDVDRLASDTIGRSRLVLKAEKAEELMYFTTDDD